MKSSPDVSALTVSAHKTKQTYEPGTKPSPDSPQKPERPSSKGQNSFQLPWDADTTMPRQVLPGGSPVIFTVISQLNQEPSENSEDGYSTEPCDSGPLTHIAPRPASDEEDDTKLYETSFSCSGFKRM